MFSRFINRHNPLGCFVGSRGIRLLQVLRAQGDVVEIASQSAPLPTFEDNATPKERSKTLADTVRQLVKSGGFQGRAVISALPSEQLWCRKLRLAPMPDPEVASAAHFLAARELGIGVESFTSETIKLATVRDGSSKLEVLTIGADSNTLEDHARMLLQAGLEPQALDAAPWAVARTLTGLPSSGESDPLLVLDVREKSTDMIIASRGEVLFLHRVEGGTLRIAELLAQRLDVSLTQARRMYDHPDAAPASDERDVQKERLAEASADAARMFGRELTREVSLSLFHFREVLHGGVPEVGVMVGKPAASNEILACVTQLTGIQFRETLDLLGRPWRDALSHRPGGVEEWLVASGLALYDVAPAVITEAA